ncbi:helix-turn-helix domain-containing protein [Helicobacter muridarum]|nr:hypothetical protein [Helicobacter muridarum]STQ85759.1 terminase [Helicobacter muridarum]
MNPKKELLKKEVRTYYETHFDSTKEVSKRFGINERTLYHWISSEKWQAGKLVKNIESKKIVEQMLKDSLGSQTTMAKGVIKEAMKYNMQGLYSVYQERILDNAADEILLKAMSEDFINKQMVKTALIAQGEFNRYASISIHSEDPNAQVIKLARDVISIFSDMKKSIYSKDDDSYKLKINNFISGVASKEEIGALSDDEIRQILSNTKS